MYLDSAYIVKYYLNEADSPKVRALIEGATVLISSAWAVAEVGCAFHRHLREGRLSESQHRELLDAFADHKANLWEFVPVSGPILEKATARIRNLPSTVFIRAGDAIHLTTAADLGESEIWTSDRHVMAAAAYFGLAGRKS